MQDSGESHDPRPAQQGPSWGIMLLMIALAILAATAIAWAFIAPMVHRH